MSNINQVALLFGFCCLYLSVCIYSQEEGLCPNGTKVYYRIYLIDGFLNYTHPNCSYTPTLKLGNCTASATSVNETGYACFNSKSDICEAIPNRPVIAGYRTNCTRSALLTIGTSNNYQMMKEFHVASGYFNFTGVVSYECGTDNETFVPRNCSS